MWSNKLLEIKVMIGVEHKVMFIYKRYFSLSMENKKKGFWKHRRDIRSIWGETEVGNMGENRVWEDISIWWILYNLWFLFHPGFYF